MRGSDPRLTVHVGVVSPGRILYAVLYELRVTQAGGVKWQLISLPCLLVWEGGRLHVAE